MRLYIIRSGAYNHPHNEGGDAYGNEVILFLAAVLFAAMWMDICKGRIDNRLILIGLAGGFTAQIIYAFPTGWPDMLLGLIMPILLFGLFFLIRAIGAGDIKLLMIIGCACGTTMLFRSIWFSLILAGSYALLLLLRSGLLLIALSDFFTYCQLIITRRQLMPYPVTVPARRMHLGPFLYFGFLCAVLDAWIR